MLQGEDTAGAGHATHRISNSFDSHSGLPLAGLEPISEGLLQACIL